jgi:hypothetical protein
LSSYINLFKTNNPVPEIGLAKNFVSFISYGIYLAIPFAFAIIPFKKKGRSWVSPVTDKCLRGIIPVILFWIVPPLLFFLFFHYAKGYFLVCAGGLFAFVGIIIMKRSARPVANLCLIIIVQILIFLFMPFRQPGVQVNIIPAKRSISVFNIWMERFLSSYSMSASHIRSINSEKEDFDNKLEFILSFQTNQKKSVILIDPSCRLNARILQARYPCLAFSRLNVKDKYKYELLYGINERSQTGWNDILSRSVVITNSSFFNSSLSQFSEKAFSFNDFTAYSVRPGMESTVSGIYSNLFSGKR